MFKIGSPEFTLGQIMDAWNSQKERIEEEASDILKLYERDSSIAKVTKAFMELPKFKALRLQLGIL